MSSAWYRIRVSGELESMTVGAFPDLQSEVQKGHTVLSGELPDRSALYGVIARLEALGLELIDISRTTGAAEPGA